MQRESSHTLGGSSHEHPDTHAHAKLWILLCLHHIRSKVPSSGQRCRKLGELLGWRQEAFAYRPTPGQTMELGDLTSEYESFAHNIDELLSRPQSVDDIGSGERLGTANEYYHDLTSVYSIIGEASSSALA